jgi:hypothetical protein
MPIAVVAMCMRGSASSSITRYRSAACLAALSGKAPPAANAASSSVRRKRSASSAMSVDTPRRRNARARPPARVKLSGAMRRRSESAAVYARRISDGSWASRLSRAIDTRRPALVTERGAVRRLRSRARSDIAGSGTSAISAQNTGCSCSGDRGAPRYRVLRDNSASVRAVSPDASVPGPIRTWVGFVDATS